MSNPVCETFADPRIPRVSLSYRPLIRKWRQAGAEGGGQRPSQRADQSNREGVGDSGQPQSGYTGALHLSAFSVKLTDGCTRPIVVGSLAGTHLRTGLHGWAGELRSLKQGLCPRKGQSPG